MKKTTAAIAFLILTVAVSSLFAQGIWRWNQKVLVDPEAKSLVGYDNPVPSSVSYQLNLIPAKKMQLGNTSDARLASEDTVYAIQADVVAYKIESNDNDYHIVLMDPKTGETIVSEIPKPDLQPASTSDYNESFTTARRAFEQILSAHGLHAPTTSLNGDLTGSKFKIRVTVVGVGFWDLYGHLDKKSGIWVGHGSGSAVSGREIHPILAIMEGSIPSPNPVPLVLRDTSAGVIGGVSPSQPKTPVPSAPIQTQTASSMTPIDPVHALAFVLLASLMGMAGQLFRVIVGLKKASDANPGQKTADIFSGSQFLISLGIAALVGGGAGILAAVTTQSYVVTQATYFTFLAAGYAGTDFIEGFAMKS